MKIISTKLIRKKEFEKKFTELWLRQRERMTPKEDYEKYIIKPTEDYLYENMAKECFRETIEFSEKCRFHCSYFITSINIEVLTYRGSEHYNVLPKRYCGKVVCRSNWRNNSSD